MTAPAHDAAAIAEGLLPCPFDGRPAYLEQVDSVRWRVCCAYCAVKRGGYLLPEDAAASWNTRAHISQAKGE